MIDPLHSLAFSVQANPGVYAVMLGSGVSRSAKIPTGWEITLDLVRKLAHVAGEACDPTPEDWYRQKFNRDPDYSELLDALAKTPAERQQLLRCYWEATEDERNEGAKLPTSAHRAIADLAAKGYIRLIVTTNFDRLMETALANVGVTPTVLSSVDQMHGALPLIHTRCCLFKLHGDYLDTRIRNTPLELAAYPPEFDTLLDKVFDEFGLIVCGWSADWDQALRNAVMRSPSRRFTTYWAARGEPSEAARQLIQQRGAQTVTIKDSDTFFSALHEQVQSLDEFSRPHPLSTEAVVASLKRYLSEPKYRIQLADLIGLEVEKVVGMASGSRFVLQGASVPDPTTFTARVRAYEAACETLLAIAPVGGFWAEEPHYYIWQKALAQLATHRAEGGYTTWMELQRYPATLLFYALGLGAVEAGRLEFVGKLFATLLFREDRKDQSAVQLLPALCLFQLGTEPAKLLEGMKDRYVPLNDWLHKKLCPVVTRIMGTDTRYSFVFDKLEILMALGYAHHAKRTKDRYWAPSGAYSYRHDNWERVISEIRESLLRDGDRSPYVTSRIFGDTQIACTEALEAFLAFANEHLRKWH